MNPYAAQGINTPLLRADEKHVATVTPTDEEMLRLFTNWLSSKGLKGTEQCLVSEIEKLAAVAYVEPPAPVEVVIDPDRDTWESPDDLGFVRVPAKTGEEFSEILNDDVARNYLAQYGSMPPHEAHDYTSPEEEVFRNYCSQYAYQLLCDPNAIAYYHYLQQLLLQEQLNRLQKTAITVEEKPSEVQEAAPPLLPKEPKEEKPSDDPPPPSSDSIATNKVTAASVVVEECKVEIIASNDDEEVDVPAYSSPLIREIETSAGTVQMETYPQPLNKTREPVYESFSMKVIYEVGKTGFEQQKDFPIKTNSLIAGRYQVLEYLGSAAFSRAVHCYDMKTDQMVCIKIIRNSKDFLDQSLDEIKLLQYINANGDPDEKCVLQLYEYFYFKEHLFLVCELLRDNLYEFSKYDRETSTDPYFTIPRLQKITKQILTALQFIHSLNLIHCDLKPENILLKSYSRCEIKVIDFGSSCYTTDHLSSYVQSRCYRAPEVILGLPYGQKIDMWSVGCILAELFTGRVIFHNESVPTMMARIVAICGDIPESMLRKAKYSHRFYSRRGVMFEKVPGKHGEQVNFLYPKKCQLKHRVPTTDNLFLDFISKLLSVDPDKRPTATEALSHPFLLHDYGQIHS